MKLTRRQQEFISNLIDLSAEVDSSIHYSVLAERLGVSPFTAYDMLCVLEEKGLVRSEYQLAAGKDGPGRAERLFYPTRLAQERDERISARFGGRLPDKEELKKIVFSGVEIGEIWNRELAEEILARVPDIEHGEISYCVEIMTVAVLRLRSPSGRQLLLDYMPQLLPDAGPQREHLSLLGGFTFSLLAQECVEGDGWVQKLFEYIQQYLSIVQHLSRDQCQRLARELCGVFGRLAENEND